VVFTNTQATRVLLQGRRAVGVLARRGGESLELRARAEVVLAAGALQSPQLLMLSGIGAPSELQAHGLAVAHALPGVGANLHDHPDVVLVVDAPRATDSFGLSPGGLWRVARAIGTWRRDRSGPLTTNFAEAGGFLHSHPEETVPDLQLHFVVGKLVDHGRQTVLGHGYSLHVCLLQPRSRGRLRLADANPLSAPLIDPNFLADSDDLDRLVRGFKISRRILEQPALAALGGREHAASAQARSDEQIAGFIRNHADTIYHPVGTCRMGADEQAVVDAQLRVHGVQGLRVVDASVMPRIVSGNTNAPVIMLAERAAAMLKAARQGRDEMQAAHLPLADAA
jgi:choline dehydrogenase-like flavoprotein